MTMILLRSIRQWWKKQTPEGKAQIRGRVAERKYLFALAAGLFGLAGLFHCFTHIQETPITHRKRYISLTPDQFQKISQFEYETVSTLIDIDLLESLFVSLFVSLFLLYSFHIIIEIIHR